MQYQHLVYRIKGFYRVGSYALRHDNMPDATQLHRQKVLAFWSVHGLAATLDAFSVSRRTLYYWKRARGERGMAGLSNVSCAPLARRQRHWSWPIRQQLRVWRVQMPNLGKEQLFVLLQPWCQARGWACPSTSTIGRLIKDASDRMRVSPPALTAKGKPKPFKKQVPKDRRPKHYRPQTPGEIIGLDAIERRMGQLRRFILCAIDEASGYAIALAVPQLNSTYNTHFVTVLGCLTPFAIQQINTDNGQENKKHFDAFLRENAIGHLWTYPRTPKMNAVCERFNRTIQEQFVDYHEHLLFDDIDLFNQKLAEWLVTYNSIRPHKGKNLLTPVQYLLNHNPKCNMCWTHTLPIFV